MTRLSWKYYIDYKNTYNIKIIIIIYCKSISRFFFFIKEIDCFSIIYFSNLHENSINIFFFFLINIIK